MNLQRGEPSSHRVLSYADGIAVLWQDFLLLVGRVMIGWIFLQSGWGKLFNIAGVGKTFPPRGLPALLEERLDHGRIHRFVFKGLWAFQLRQLAEQEALTRDFSIQVWWSVPDRTIAPPSSTGAGHSGRLG